jgi:two-component system CheB/CheR fusion protein
VQIFATDVSETAIERARAGLYSESIAADVPEPVLRRHFSKADGGYKISKALRDVCVFARHDLTRDPPFSRLDLIVCRNVLIYLDAELQRRLMSVFHYALNPDGYLILGPAETAGHQHLFGVVDKKWRIYRKTAVEVGLPVTLPTDQPAARSPPTAADTPEAARQEAGRLVQAEASRILLQRYSPAGVVVDHNFRIVQFRGQTGRYLEAAAGEPSLSILKMAREGLLFTLRMALHAAQRKHRTVRKEGVAIRHNGDWREVNVEVTPLGSETGGHFLVVFEDAAHEPAPQKQPGKPRPKQRVMQRDVDERVRGLTRELTASREYLQSIIQELEAANEELQSANEEILSSNEELQSTNEELDTAKEELQSTNEELNTVNEELHSRNQELSRLNSDLINLLASVDITIAIVGDDMRIRRYTPMAERVLNLISTDIGRSIEQINPNIVCPELGSLIRESIERISTVEREVQDREGHWYSLRIRPYKSVDNRIDGAVVALIDIDVAKRHEQQVERSRNYFLAIVETVRQPVLVLDEELRVRTANKAFYTAFRLQPQHVEGSAVHELGGIWSNPTLRQRLKDVIEPSHETDFTAEFAIETERPSRLLVNATRLAFEDSTSLVLISTEEVTGEKESLP